MAGNTIDSYLAWITPTAGDPTHSLLRAHLMFEQLLDAFLKTTLPHPSALADARLTFAQKLAISRAAAVGIAPTDWCWHALGRLNKIRNTLAHSPSPKLSTDLKAYVDYCVKHSGSPLPKPDARIEPKLRRQQGIAGPAYTAADMVTIGLYIRLAGRLGFDIESFAGVQSAA